jgi:signal peptidase II
MILSGSIGNILDRTRYGYVIDFIDVYYQQWHYWTFNFADTFIVLGLIGWLICDLVLDRKT